MILHCISNLMSGGAEAMLCRLVTRSATHGVGHQVVSMLPNGIFADELQARGIPVHNLCEQSDRSRLPAITRFAKLVRAIRPDVIQAWMYHANFIVSVAAPLYATRVPVIWNVRQTLPSLRGETPRTQLVIVGCAPMSWHPRAIVYNALTAAVDHEAWGYNSARRLIIPNGFDLARFKPDFEARSRLSRSLGLPEDALILGRVARLHPMKDFDTLFQAFNRVAASEKRAHLVLAGRGMNASEPELSALIGASSAKDRIHLLDETSRIDRIVPAFDIALSTSARSEAFPNVIGEAMACGVPVVATDIAESASIVNDPTRIVPPRNPDAFAARVLALLALSADERKRIGACDRARIEAAYPLDRITAVYEGLWQSTAAGLRSGRDVQADVVSS